MDSDDLTKTLKLAKKQLEENNKLFIKSLDKKIASELKFRASICRIAKSTDSVLDMLSLRGELKDEESCNGEMKTDLKSLVDLCLKLKKEANLSRIRSRGLEKFADEMRLCFGIKSAKPIMIPDSPTKPIRKSSRHCQLVPFTSNVSKYIMICRYSWGKKSIYKISQNIQGAYEINTRLYCRDNNQIYRDDDYWDPLSGAKSQFHFEERTNIV